MFSRLCRQLPLILTVVAVGVVLTASVNAAVIVIPTNQGGGADTELRESWQTVELDGTVHANHQGGAMTELATRVKTAARSSVAYMKFDISGLPAADSSFWNNRDVKLRINVRHENLVRNSRLEAVVPGGDPNNPADWARMEFAVRGLEPANTYGDDDAAEYTRTDRSGNTYSSPHYEYNWDEGSGDDYTTGITHYDAPGVTPHCMLQGSCDTVEYGGLASDTLQSKGRIDDWNSDVRLLGTWNWPKVDPQNHLPVGLAIDFVDPDVTTLVKDAKVAGRDYVTLIVSHNLDPAQDNVTLPTSFFNFNYIINPKEQNPLRTNTGYDPSVYHPFNPTGSPWSGADNSLGQFSPKLMVVPEPATLVLIGLGLAGLALVRRRR